MKLWACAVAIVVAEFVIMVGAALFSGRRAEPGRIEIAYYVTGTRDTVLADDWRIESEMVTLYSRGVAVTSVNLQMVGRVRRIP